MFDVPFGTRYYYCMKRVLLIHIIVSTLVLSMCTTTPVQEGTKPLQPGDVPVTTVEEKETKPDPAITSNKNNLETIGEDDIVVRFDTIAITKHTFIATKSEIELVVEDLNQIVLRKDYVRWQEYLSDDYIETFSDKTMLESVSRSLPVKGIKLKTLKDYFTYVFVPSRQNMRVDDIQFVSPTRVYVIMEITPDSPAAIYILENTSVGWKLVPKKTSDVVE